MSLRLSSIQCVCVCVSCSNTLEEVTFNADDLRAYAQDAAKDTQSAAQGVAADSKSGAKDLADKV